MTPSQILLSTIIIFIIFRTLIAYRKRNFSIGFTLLWVIFWFFGLIIIYEQNFVILLAKSVGISRGVDLVIYFSLILIFYLIYKLFIKIDDLERTITKLVRKIAINEVQKNKRR